MKHKFTKVMHIINSLVDFCYHVGAKEYTIHLKTSPEVTEFVIKAEVQNADMALLRELEGALRLQRMHEVEQNFWELGGEMDSYDEMELVGMMLDEAEIEYKNDELVITAVRRR